MARITRVDACEPELPPLEIIKGTNKASTTARLISFSKKPIAEAVSISPIKSSTSHPALFFTICKKEIVKYGSPKASIPANLWISSVASSSATSKTSSIVTIPINTPNESTTGSAILSYFLNTWTAVSWSSVTLRATKFSSIKSMTFFSRGAKIISLILISSINFPFCSIT